MTSKLIFGILLCMMLIAPALATPYPSGSYTDSDSVKLTDVSSAHYNVTKGNAIGNVVFTVPIGTNIAFTLGYGSSDTISGEINYYGIGSELMGMEYSTNSYSRVALDGNESANTFWDVGGGLVNRYAITGHAVDEDTGTEGLAVWDTSLLNFYSAENIAYVPITNIGSKPIYWIDIESDRPIEIEIAVGEQSYIQGEATKSISDILNDWLNLFKGVGSFFYGVVTTTLNWVVFLWSNIGLIIALYLALTGFMAFQQGKKNIPRSIGIFLGYQKKLFETLLALPHYIMDLIEKARNILRLI